MAKGKKPVKTLAEDVAAIQGELGITRRPAEVAYFIVLHDMTAGEAARVLGIDVTTAKSHLRRLRDRHQLSRIKLVKRVCAAVWGELDQEMLGSDGRLSVRALVRRLRVPPYLAVVMRLVWEDRSAKEIAQALSLSMHTAANYRERLRDKLKARSVAALVRLAYEEFTREGLRRGPEEGSASVPDDLGR